MTYYEPDTFIIIPNKRDLEGKPAEMQSIFLWLCNYLDKNGQCFPSRTTLAKQSGCGLRTVDKYLKQLEEDGFLTKKPQFKGRDGQTSNLYKVQILQKGEQEMLTPRATDDTPPVSKTTHELNITNSTNITQLEEAKASTLGSSTTNSKLNNKLSPGEMKYVGAVATIWKDMASQALDIPKKDVEDSKLFIMISNFYKKEKWDRDDFKALFKHFFDDEGMKRENKLAYSICLSGTYIAKYKLSKKGKTKTFASMSDSIRL